VLIGLYRLPKQTEEQRSRTQSLINHAAEESRQMIEEFPDDATAYNQFAWLVGNTDGDVDEAIAMSHKSIEIRRAGGYLDTLAHCYFAKGDFENAVKYQSEAAELEPHSQLISRQLNVFKQALEKSQATANP
jgi:tetratricopeptide (TPR) repeat protein